MRFLITATCAESNRLCSTVIPRIHQSPDFPAREWRIPAAPSNADENPLSGARPINREYHPS
jgi:hypothetical protein